MSLRASVAPAEIATSPGLDVEFEVTVTNALDVVDAVTIRVLGIDPTWVTVFRERVQLFPEDDATVGVYVRLPDDFPAGRRLLTVEVMSELAPQAPTLLTVVLNVDVRNRIDLGVEPALVIVGSTGTFAVTLANQGNAPTRIELLASDPEAAERIEFDRSVLEIDPGAQVSTTMRVKGKRPWFGQPVSRVVTVSVVGAPEGSERFVTVAHRPRIGRMLLSFVGLLIAASVFGIVFTRNLSKVVETTAVDPAILEQAFGAATPGAGVEPGGIAGLVSARSSGDGIAGATVELYLAADAATPIRSVATDEDGRYSIGNLGPGPFRLRAVAAGFDSRWFGDVAAFDNATDVAVEAGDTTGGIDVVLGGQPATLSGTVVGGAVKGARVDLIVPAAATGGTQDALYLSVEVDETGTFLFENVPAPASYRLRVTQIGSVATETRLQVAAGEARTGIMLQLRTGDGLIAGTVFGESGPLGAATVTVASGDTSAGTLTLTSGAVGTFSVPGLLTPATYTVSVTADGYRPVELTVSLASGQSLVDLIVAMEPATGSISGRVTTVTGAPATGVPVLLSDGTSSWSTTTLTSDDPSTPRDDRGRYRITGLVAPGVYTLTIGGGTYAPVVRTIALNAETQNVVSSVQVALATASVLGTVSDVNGPAGGVTVSLSDGATVTTATTATRCSNGGTACVGTYRFDGVAPGTYTITFSRTGSQSLSRLLVLRGGDSLRSDALLQPRAGVVVQVCTRALTGTVGTCDPGTVLVAYQVRLWLASAYPTSQPVAVALTAGDGTARFNDLDAPLRYIVEVAPAAGQPGVSSLLVDLKSSEVRNVDVIVSEPQP